jgi:hypothetical protein
MPENADLRRYMVLLLTVVMFLAGFALADTVLFSGGTMPAWLSGASGWLVCGAAGVYAAVLFHRANRK